MPRGCERCDEGVCTWVYYGSSHHGTDVLAHDDGGGGGGVHFISMAHTVERMRSLMVMVVVVVVVYTSLAWLTPWRGCARSW
jgi:hypothetical protein